MTQNVMVEIGQCGNQIGRRFWEMALAEHSGVKSDLNFDDTLASFFRNTDSKSGKVFWVKNFWTSLKSNELIELRSYHLLISYF